VGDKAIATLCKKSLLTNDNNKMKDTTAIELRSIC